jgi:glycosyltransferase involved in cell wall biosynthesis
MKSDMISIIIPAFNAEKYIAEAVESALSQTYKNFEIIVVNDGSTDSTKSVLSEYSSQITIIDITNGGVSVARNTGILTAKGQYIALLDSDDLWHPEKLEFQVDYLKRNPEVVMISGGREKFSETDEIRVKKSACVMENVILSHHDILRRNPIHCSSVLIQKHIFSRSGLFDPRSKGAEDEDLWARIASIGRVSYSNDPLSWLRVHGQNTTKSFSFRLNRLITFRIMKQYWAHDPVATKIIRNNMIGNLVAVAYEAADRGELHIAKNNFKDAYLVKPQKIKFLMKYAYYSSQLFFRIISNRLLS